MILKNFFFEIRDKIVPINEVIRTYNDPGYIFNLNLFSLGLIIKNQKFRSSFYGARLVHIDGRGASLVLRLLLGEKFKSYGYRQWASKIFECKNTDNIFFLGGTEVENNLAVNKVSSEYSHISVAGINGYVGYDCMVKALKKTSAKLIFVGIGMPRQEILIERISVLFPEKTFFACGGWIKQLSGLENECPKVFLNLGLEWLFRSISRSGHLSQRVIEPTKLIFCDIFLQ